MRIAAKGNVDLIDDFAAAIPIEVIGNLLDVPQAEREPLRDWSLAILGALEPVISAGGVCPRQQGGEGFSRPIWKSWSSGGAPNPAIPNATC